MRITDELKHQAMQLPLRDREELLLCLEHSVLTEWQQVSESQEMPLVKLCEERLKQLQAGELATLPAGEVIAELRGHQ